jgi:hypothetical protein
MKIHIEHDEHGNIHSIGASAGGDGTTTLRAGPGLHVIEIEAPDVEHPNDVENLRAVKRLYRVERHHAQPTLVRK